MNFKAKYISLIIIAVFSFGLKAEDSRTAENTEQFKASDFFSPFRSGETSSSWPEKLTLTRMMFTPFADIINQILSTEWEAVFHCSGQNIPTEKHGPLMLNIEGFDYSVLEKYSIVDGRVEVTRTFYPHQSEGHVVVNPSLVVKFTDLGFGKIIIDDGLSLVEYQMYQLKETDELAFQQDGSLESAEICPENTELKRLLVPYSRPKMTFEIFEI